ncbi:Lsr2 dimerization domain-containing protein [Plantibacter sp. CFBP 8775]|uniref:Lsr2 dimerization domain-containing protein n=1 Tax=Plantibacter sp. CFBP 8775 TaxID=2774038 RepID=UPI00177E21EA|nr:histone-like nucleoid-structuring protein Lsr2 [Plantibacter sp. CFBP 8775]MBD8102490.1 Lsr2 family protein [Plantibacter sp. CFBP 8775]
MSKRTVITTVDDLDGTVLEPGGGETVRFAIDGRRYEIDLTAENAAALRDMLRPFTEAGRRVRVKARRRGRK